MSSIAVIDNSQKVNFSKFKIRMQVGVTQVYLDPTKSSGIVIGNFISQWTFKRLLPGQIGACLIYNDIYSKPILDLGRNSTNYDTPFEPIFWLWVALTS